MLKRHALGSWKGSWLAGAGRRVSVSFRGAFPLFYIFIRQLSVELHTHPTFKRYPWGGKTRWVLEENLPRWLRGGSSCVSVEIARVRGGAWTTAGGHPGAARTQADGHGWVGARGRPWVAASQTLGTHHASFPRVEAV